MKVGEICVRDVIVVKKHESLNAAAQLMRKYHIGSLIVIEQTDGMATPVGILTDRDLVVEVLAPGVDPDLLVVGDIMTTDLLSVGESQDLSEALEGMQQRGVRRAPVVDGSGALIGILSVDDILEALNLELGNFAKLFSREKRREAVTRK